MQTFIGRDYPFLTLFPQKPYFQNISIFSRSCVPVSHNKTAQEIQKVSFFQRIKKSRTLFANVSVRYKGTLS